MDSKPRPYPSEGDFEPRPYTSEMDFEPRPYSSEMDLEPRPYPSEMDLEPRPYPSEIDFEPRPKIGRTGSYLRTWCYAGEFVQNGKSNVNSTAWDMLTTPNTDNMLVDHRYIKNEEILSAKETGESMRKGTSNVNSYLTAWDILTRPKTVNTLEDQGNIRNKEIMSTKETGNEVKNNLLQLRKFKKKNAGLKKKIEDLVIIEHFYWARDRTSYSFCILHLSCVHNGIYMEWETKLIKAPSLFKCTITVDYQVTGVSFGYSKQHARIIAAAEVLYKLYESNTVIRIWPSRDIANEDWIPYGDIKKEAESLRRQGTEPNDDENPLQDSFVFEVIDNRLSEYVENNKEDASDLIFGPGFTERQIGYLHRQANRLNLKIGCQQKQGKIYLLIYEKFDWDKLGAILRKKENRRYGRYELVPKSELPTCPDIGKSALKRKFAIEEMPKHEQEDTLSPEKRSG